MIFKKILFSIMLLLLCKTAYSTLFGKEEWIEKYVRPCVSKNVNLACADNTKIALKRMLRHKKMVFKYLDEYAIPKWWSAIPIIESSYYENATSKRYSKRLKRDVILAVGLWQISPGNLQYYLSTNWNGINFKYTRTPKIDFAIKRGYDKKISTEIACRLISDLYSNYRKEKYKVYIRDNDDINRFVAMAYNAGQRRVDNALKGIGNPLTDETINYYEQLRALWDVMDGYDAFFSD